MEVIATIETWVAAEVGIREGSVAGGWRVPMTVPRLVRNVSPGPFYKSGCTKQSLVIKLTGNEEESGCKIPHCVILEEAPCLFVQ